VDTQTSFIYFYLQRIISMFTDYQSRDLWSSYFDKFNKSKCKNVMFL